MPPDILRCRQRAHFAAPWCGHKLGNAVTAQRLMQHLSLTAQCRCNKNYCAQVTTWTATRIKLKAVWSLPAQTKKSTLLRGQIATRTERRQV